MGRLDRSFVAALAAGLLAAAPAGATWSIAAVDPATREVGVAGASCIGGVRVIAGLVPGHGAVAAQALSHAAGRDRAKALLAEGRAPGEILAEIATEAWDPAPWHRFGGWEMRQYAVVSLDGPAQAAWTGARTTSWAGARLAPGVAVTGNLLVGPEVLDAALSRFGADPEGCTPTLADRLVAALHAGARQGGDRRCVPELGALSAFVAVAGPDDRADGPGLWIGVPYEGPSEIPLQPLRLFWPKAGDAEDNPVTTLVERYRRHRTAHGRKACLPPSDD